MMPSSSEIVAAEKLAGMLNSAIDKADGNIIVANNLVRDAFTHIGLESILKGEEESRRSGTRKDQAALDRVSEEAFSENRKKKKDLEVKSFKEGKRIAAIAAGINALTAVGMQALNYFANKSPKDDDFKLELPEFGESYVTRPEDSPNFRFEDVGTLAPPQVEGMSAATGPRLEQVLDVPLTRPDTAATALKMNMAPPSPPREDPLGSLTGPGNELALKQGPPGIRPDVEAIQERDLSLSPFGKPREEMTLEEKIAYGELDPAIMKLIQGRLGGGQYGS